MKNKIKNLLKDKTSRYIIISTMALIIMLLSFTLISNNKKVDDAKIAVGESVEKKEKSSEAKKVEDKKSEEKKSTEVKSEEKKSEAKKVEDKKSEEKKPEDNKTASNVTEDTNDIEKENNYNVSQSNSSSSKNTSSNNTTVVDAEDNEVEDTTPSKSENSNTNSSASSSAVEEPKPAVEESSEPEPEVEEPKPEPKYLGSNITYYNANGEDIGFKGYTEDEPSFIGCWFAKSFDGEIKLFYDDEDACYAYAEDRSNNVARFANNFYHIAYYKGLLEKYGITQEVVDVYEGSIYE